MYKLLIADDEYWVRKRLLDTIDWQSIGIGEVYGAEDGKKALCISIQHEPDIVVTDINMPGLSGIELMQALHLCALFPQFILISGFIELEYAASAIKLGVVDCLLKPIDEKELIHIVKMMIEDFDYHKKEKEHLDAQSFFRGRNMKSIAVNIKNCDKAAATRDLELLLNEFMRQNNQNPTPIQIKLFYINIMNVLIKDGLASIPPSEEFLSLCIDSLDDIGTFFTPEKLMNNLLKIVDYLLSES